MIGSRTKNAAVFGHLLSKGFTQEDISRTHAPIGVAIKAQTPEEIAVSILAEMIAVRRTSGVKTAETAGGCKP
jgi:xanthine dehydrogenase accessory factor